MNTLRLSLPIETIKDKVAILEGAVNQIRNARVACESRIVNEQLIPVKMIKKRHEDKENRNHVLATEYYGYMQVDKLTVIDDELYCIITGPSFEAYTHMELTVKTLPMYEEDRCAQPHQPPPFIIDYETEDLYFPDECHGPTPKACRPEVLL